MSSSADVSSKGTVMAAVALNDSPGISRCTAGCFHCIVQSVSESGWMSTKRSYTFDTGSSHLVVLRLALLLFHKVPTLCLKSSFINRNIREQRPSMSIMPFRNMKQKFYPIIPFSFTCIIFPCTLTLHCIYIKCVYWNIDMLAFKHMAKVGILRCKGYHHFTRERIILHSGLFVTIQIMVRKSNISYHIR